MTNINTKIGEHNIRLVCENKKLVNFLTHQFLIRDHGRKIDLSILIEKGYGQPFKNYDVDVCETQTSITFKRADYKITVDPNYTQAEVHVHNELALKHALMNLYSSFIVHKNWGILLHSSCVLETNGAHIFTGHSGAGKSTAAKLSAPRPLLSDEATIIKIAKDGILAYDSPFRSELHGHAPVSNIKLLSIDLLHQSLSIERNRVDKSSALLALLDKVFYWPSNKEETKRILTMMRFLVEHVDIYDLYFQKNNRFWEMIS
ncbi:hypothetical protein AB1K32_06325 [Metabacillus dongyingensis]|uniref:hypothetical protein n=1 Tax=Metabacillus dongyingensis TaxID=2874282 RepID=UPI003B8CA321